MKAALRGIAGPAAFAGAAAAAFFLFLSAAFANTTVTKTGECTVEVMTKIEIFTATGKSKEDMEKIAEEWQSEMESAWNGPTKADALNAAGEMGLDADQIEEAVKGNNHELRKKIDDAARKALEEAGAKANCININCCQIYFKFEIKVRDKDDPASEGYHQVEVKGPNFHSKVIRRDASDITKNQQGATGEWGYDPNDPQAGSAAHECGHLMGLHDQYHNHPDGTSSTKPGHEGDIMDWSFGWPQEDAVEQIMSIAGVECDCCPDDAATTVNDLYVRYGATFRTAGDAILTGHCEVLKQLEQDYLAQLGNVNAANIPVGEKADLQTKINKQLKKVREALEDCNGEEKETALVIPGVPLTFDSRVCVNYGGGTTTVPVGPGGIGFPVGPVSGPVGTPPTGPATTPGTTPGETPETPGTTPGTPPTGPVTPIGPEGFDPGDLPGIPTDFFDPGSDPFLPPFIGPDTVVPRLHPDGTPTRAEDTPTIPIEIVQLDLVSTTPIPVAPPEDEEEEEDQPETVAPPVMVVKAEQTVLEGGEARTKPVQGATLKLGYPPPPLPGTTTRTAEATDDQHDREPRHVVTNSDGVGVIFADGFESGDVSAWTNRSPEKVSATGVKVDLTPTKSSIVYVGDPIGASAQAGTPARGVGRQARMPGEGKAEAPIGGARAGPAAPAAGRGGAGEAAKKGAEAAGKAVSGADGAGTAVKAAAERAFDAVVSEPGASDAVGQLPATVRPYVIDAVKFGDTWGLTLNYKYNWEDQILNDLEGYEVEENHYREKQQEGDPYFESKGSWGQGYDDQWAIKRAGFTKDDDSAWAYAGGDLSPVVVAVIDTGLDWNHADISWDNIWQNEGEIPDNGIDDDGNGYVDDLIGWDFYTNSNQPWDQDGHGTFVAGVIAAASGNGIGIRGINPAAQIMVLKALNDFGHTRASYLAKAIKYAADNGARVINISAGGGSLTKLERMAVEYANAAGAVVVVAAGNFGMKTENFGLSPYPEVITVTSTDPADERTVFSNWGPEVDVAAPGVDVLSLRARRTDLMRYILAVEYQPGTAYVGEDRRYYRAAGTSFSAPIVAGLASLILSNNPALTNEQVKRMILQTARDIEVPGRDQYTGYGLVDAATALRADPEFEIIAEISGIDVVQRDGQTFVAVSGTAGADRFDRAQVSIGQGEAPDSFREDGAPLTQPVESGVLALIPAEAFRTAPVWTIRLVVTHENGKIREQWYTLTLG